MSDTKIDKIEETKNTNSNTTLETDYNENDMLSMKNNVDKTESPNKDKSKIYSNREVFDLELNEEFKDVNIKNNHLNREKVFMNMNSQELICFVFRMMIFILGISFMLIVISKILTRENK